MSYSNDDLAVVPNTDRSWTTRHYAALWMGMSFSIPAYMLASSLLSGGMSWYQALLAIFIGNSIVLIPMVLNSHAGTKYGIPFPIYVRASFGIRGAQLPALIRALIACGWFGIQAWIGSEALYALLSMLCPGIATLPAVLPSWVGLDSGHGLAFFLFWCLNIVVIMRGMALMRKLLVVQSYLLVVITVLLVLWAAFSLDGLKALSLQQSKFTSTAAFWAFFFPALTAIVGYFSTICLNIPDFTRYAVSQRAQIVGQSISLPTSMTLITFVGVFVTAATSAHMGQMEWNPVILAGFIPSYGLRAVVMLVVIFITLVANVALNIVSPANDFSHLKPSLISFKTGGVITAVIAALIMPWKLIADPNGYIFTWLTGVSALLGSIVGIMLSDYYLIRKKRLDVTALYQGSGEYWYHAGVNLRAVVALLLGVLVNLPGFLVQVQLIPAADIPQWLRACYDYAWFIGLLVSTIAYLILMRVNNDKNI